MKLGLFGINMGPCCDPAVAARVARAAEEAGFESLWTGEHVVLPEPQAPPSPLPPRFPFLDPAVALTFVAGVTSRVRLGTGIIVLPQRNPLVLAKELASVDVLSGGRLILGIGAGYLRPELAALGIPFERRDARTDEYLSAILALWTEDRPAFRGAFVSFAGVNAFPRPVQRPHPPIVVGGSSAAAFRRAVTRAHGWYGFGLDPETTARRLAGLARAGEHAPRPAALGELEISVSPPPGRLAAEDVRRYAGLGVHRLVAVPVAETAEALVAQVHAIAEAAAGGR
jgi:probable F420-dependent oxidoreductase